MPKKRGYFVYGRNGLGDNVYMRPFVRALVETGEKVWIETPWPELFDDLDVTFVTPQTKLRTQRKNVDNGPRRNYVRVPWGATKVELKYGWRELQKGELLKVMEEGMPVPTEPFVFDLPDFGDSPLRVRHSSMYGAVGDGVANDRVAIQAAIDAVSAFAKSGQPVAVIRPVTERREWFNKARNPDPQYIAEAAKILREKGYYIVSVADLEEGEEWIVGDMPVADERFHAGELGVTKLMALLQNADLVVGGVGFILPACLAFGTPLITIGGGQGGHNAPGKLVDERIDGSRALWVLPDKYCMCIDMTHDGCDKTISNFREKFTKAVATLEGRRGPDISQVA